MARKILDFNVCLPEIVYLDAIFIINFCIEDAKYYHPCKGFMERLEKENIPSVISNFTLDEMWYSLIWAILIRDYNREWITTVRDNPIIIQDKVYYRLVKLFLYLIDQ
ncbi:MAG: hypothetical protein AB1414_17845 [bacterium]